MEGPHDNSYIYSRFKHMNNNHQASSPITGTNTPIIRTPRPKPDLFNESSLLLSKKCRTSTPSSKIIPPRPPTKSVKRWIHKSRQSRIRRLDKKYEHVTKIGSGHFADVYSAKSLEDGQYYAIKKSRFPFQGKADRERKRQEVRNHELLPPNENCVKYIKSWEENDLLYIQTELCRTSLNEILETAEDNKLPEGVVWTYLVDLLLAVKHLHDHDLIHLDIKPENIFISFDNIAKLGDFGLMYDLKKGAIASTISCNGNNNTSINNNHLSNGTSYNNNNNQNCNVYFGNSKSKSKTQTKEQHNNTNYNNSTNNNINYNNNESPFITTSDLTNHQLTPAVFAADDHYNDNNGDANTTRSDDSDSIDEGDSKYLASETMQGKFTKAADIFSLGITIFEIASGMDLPKGGEIYHMLRHNQIDDTYFNGLSEDLTKVIKLMMEADYTKRPTIEDILQMPKIQSMVTKRKLRTTYLTSLRSIKNTTSFTFYLIMSTITMILFTPVNILKKCRNYLTKLIRYEPYDRSRLTPDSNDGEVVQEHHLSPHSPFVINSSNDSASSNSSRICSPQRMGFPTSDVSVLDNSYGDDDLLDFEYPSRRSSDTSLDDEHCYNRPILNSSTAPDIHDYSHSGSTRERARPKNLLNLFEEIGKESRTT